MADNPENTIFVKVAPLGRCVCEVSIPAGSTVSTALEVAKRRNSISDYERLRKNNVDAALTDLVQDGDLITLVPQIRGGQ